MHAREPGTHIGIESAHNRLRWNARFSERLLEAPANNVFEFQPAWSVNHGGETAGFHGLNETQHRSGGMLVKKQITVGLTAARRHNVTSFDGYLDRFVGPRKGTRSVHHDTSRIRPG